MTHARPSRREWAVLGAVTTLAGVLRFATLDVQSFWLDEAVTVQVLDRGFGAMLDQIPRTEATPPLYYVLAWAWTKVFGLGEVGLRSFSALLGTATVPLVWAAGRRLFGSRAALGAAALVAVGPLLVWYSQEGRAYALLVALGALSLWLMARLIDEPRGRDAAAWVVAAVAAVGTHYFGVFLIAGEAVVLLALVPRRLSLPTVAGAGVAGLALAPLALDQRSSGFAGYIADSSLPRRLAQAPKQLVLGFDSWLEPVTAGAAILIALAGVAVALLRPAPARRRPVLVTLGLAAAAGLVPVLLALAGTDYVLTRNLILVWLPLAALVAAGLTADATGQVGPAALTALLALSLAVSIGVPLTAAWQREDWREAAQEIGPVGDRAILVSGASSAPAVRQYREQAKPVDAAGGEVSEVVALTRRGRELGEAAATPPDPGALAATGLKVVGVRLAPTYELVRMRPVAGGPVRLNPAQLQSLRLDAARGEAAILAEQPPP